MSDELIVQLRADVNSFNQSMNQANQALLKLVEGTKKTSQATNQMANTMKGIGAGIAAAFAGKAVQALQALADNFVNLAEAPTKFKASLEALTGSSARATNMLQQVYAIAKRTGTGFEDTAALVQKLTIGLNALGANNAQIAQIAENILKLGTIGGSSIADTAAAAQQLSQALASGKLQGDELRSILERMPTLAQIIAKEMGVSVGELKKLGAEGKITSDIIANSLLKATNQINADFQKMPLTVAQAMNNVKTSIQQAFDNPAAKAAVQGLAQAINLIPKAILAADVAVRQFMNGLRSFGSSMANVFEPVTRTLDKLVQGFSNLASALGPALGPIKNILLAAFVGPIVTIISNWDSLVAYFNNKIPQMFNNLISVAAAAMANLIKTFSSGWDEIVSIAAEAINVMIGLLNKFVGLFNQASALMGGGTLIKPFEEVTGEAYKADAAVKKLTATSQAFGSSAAQYAQKYASDLRTIARTAAETQSAAEGLAVATGDVNQKFKELEVSAGGGGGGGGKGGGGGGKGGGAAGGIKKAGDAAKKAAEQMKEAQSQVEEFGQAMQGIAQSLGSGVVDALFSIAEGSKSAKEAFTELAKSMLKQIAQMIMQMLILKPLMGMFGGGMGLFGGGGGGLMGMAARSGPALMGASRSGTIGNYSGFNMSPAAMTSIRSSAVSVGATQHAAPMNVTVNNNSSAVVKTRQESDGLYIDLIEDVVSDRITRGGNKIDAALARAYGSRRVGY